MKRSILLLAPLMIFFGEHDCHGVAQTTAFEVASVTPCPPGTPAPMGEDHMMVQLTYPGGRFTAKATTVNYLIEWAYDLLPSQYGGGPAWMGSDRYDVIAKASGNATDDEMKAMVKTLLADRFHLKFRRETHDAPVLILGAGKTPPKMYPPKDGEVHNLKIMPKTDGDKKVLSYNVSATRFSFIQLNQTFAHLLDRVIVNDTGLTGDFDFTLDLAIDDSQPNPLDPGTILSAMRDQLGLTLKSQRGPVEYLAIEGLDRPAAN
jgi:uncharacterized protein (TIGR03435 family)